MESKGERSTRTRTVVSLVFSLIALVASVFIPFGGLLGIVGMALAWKVRKGVYRRIAILGIIISALAIVLMIFVFISPAFPHVFPIRAITHISSSTLSQ